MVAVDEHADNSKMVVVEQVPLTELSRLTIIKSFDSGPPLHLFKLDGRG